MARILAIIIGLCLVIVMFLSRREEGDILQRMSLFLYKRAYSCVKLRRYLQMEERQVVGSLLSLHPGAPPTELLNQYYIEKIRMVLLVLGLGSLISLGAGMTEETTGAAVQAGIVSRGREAQTILLEATIKNKGTVFREELSLEVEERALRQQEAQEQYEALTAYLEEQMKGENPSLREVRQNLYLPDEVEEYPFLIQWISGNTALLGNDGEVKVETLEEPEEVTLRAEIRYGEWEWHNSWQVILQPPIRSEREQLAFELKKYSDAAAAEHLYEESFALPDEVSGRQVSWRRKEEDTGFVVLALTLAAAVAVYRLKDRDLEKELLKRRTEIREAYPELVSKYALLLGAGMTVRGAFQKICKDYFANYKESAVMESTGSKFPTIGKRVSRPKKPPHPLYEEMLYACNELQSGVSESKVYENFGLRTGVAEYTRMCTLLNQNLKKGNSTLVQRLRAEGEEALQEGVRTKKRKGEEAGTKLLLPMIMMLLMVLLMIMLPAFSGLGM